MGYINILTRICKIISDTYGEVLINKINSSRYTCFVRKMIAETLVEWDESKNQRNIEKYDISFETAALVFADEEQIEYFFGFRKTDLLTE